MLLLRSSVLIALGLLSCPGCVAYQIRDELSNTNGELQKMDQRLDVMATELKRIDASVSQSNQILAKSNKSLVTVESSMEPIRVSLRRIDDELAGFREMIDKIDRYIPVNIKPETPAPVKQSPTQETTPDKK